MPPLRFATAALLLAAFANAQDLRWSLPPRGAAIYTRDLKVEQHTEPANAGTSAPWYGDANAAVVLAGELDDKGLRTTEPLCDLRDAFAHLALDLGTAKATKTSLALDGSGRFQAVQLDAVYGAIAADGTQEISGTFTVGKPARDAAAPSPFSPKVSGKLTGTRQLDKANGRVASLRGTIELRLDSEAYTNGTYSRPASTLHAVIRDSWTFDRLLAPGDAAFRSMVADGIRKAAEALHRRLEQPSQRASGGDPYHDTEPGELALLLLAVVKAGHKPNDPVIEKAYASLRARVIKGTYSLACAILAIEALYTPPSEWQELRAGRLKAPMPRQPSAADKALLTEWTTALLGNIDSTADSAYLRRWHYGPSQSFDNSNTQYAMLGLFAAQLCGVEFPLLVWTASGNHWLRSKTAQGDAAAPQLVTQADLERQQPGQTVASKRGGKVPMVGWSYGTGGQPTGSMTCAGITGLTLSTAGLRQMKKGSPKQLREFEDAMRGGFLWLERNFTVRRNPGPAGGWTNWYYYYLYGLERTCELNQVALLGDRDWYFEGAMQILGQQHADGSWGGSPWDSCFALLFLKKTALPAVTGR